VRAAETADLLIAASPVFRGSYTGLFKHFFDFVDQYAIAGKPVLNPEAYERIEVAVDDVLPVARLLRDRLRQDTAMRPRLR